jgi:polysaccharide pyruvyl transferase WcaK-like protein
MDMAIKGRVALLDHMGGGNLGDDATQTAVIQNIRRRRPGADIIGLSMNQTWNSRLCDSQKYMGRRAGTRRL